MVVLAFVIHVGDDYSHVVDNNENNVFVTHDYVLLGFAASSWRHLCVILQSVDRS